MCISECDFQPEYLRSQMTAKSLCPVVSAAYNKATAEACAEYACQHMGNAFNFKVSKQIIDYHIYFMVKAKWKTAVIIYSDLGKVFQSFRESYYSVISMPL